MGDWLNATPIHDKADRAEGEWKKLSEYEKKGNIENTGNTYGHSQNLFDLPTELRDKATTTSLGRKVISTVIGLPLIAGFGLGGIQVKNLASQSWQDGQNREQLSIAITKAESEARAIGILSDAKIKALRAETQALKENYDTLGVPEGARKVPIK